jgi:hypothetical protein
MNLKAFAHIPLTVNKDSALTGNNKGFQCVIVETDVTGPLPVETSYFVNCANTDFRRKKTTDGLRRYRLEFTDSNGDSEFEWVSRCEYNRHRAIFDLSPVGT